MRRYSETAKAEVRRRMSPPQPRQSPLLAQQLHRRSSSAAQALQEHDHHGRHYDPLRAARSIGIAAIHIAEAVATQARVSTPSAISG